jgi:acyl-homoserine lactone acylase PvdQ
VENTRNFAQNASADQLLPQLQMVVQELKTKFGTWEIPWGDINRFQRLSGDINLDYDDSIASLPISAARFGLLTRLQKCLSRKVRKGMVTVVIVSYVQ